MKRILGGIVCLVLPALALAQDGGTAGIDHQLAEETVILLREALDPSALPVAAARVRDDQGNLLLVGGVEATPSRTRPVRQWDPIAETWSELRQTLPPDFLPDAPVAATWIDQPAAGLLTVGMGENAAGGVVPTAFLDSLPYDFSRVAPCELPPGAFGSPAFAAKPIDAFDNKDELVLYLVTANPNTLELEGHLYGVSLVPGNTFVCLTPIVAGPELPTDHLLGSLTYDPEPRGGTGALVFAGGLETQNGSNYLQKQTPSLLFSDGTTGGLADWPEGLVAADVLPGPDGGLLFLTPWPLVPGTGAAPTLQEAHWNEGGNTYLLSGRAAHPVTTDPLRISSQFTFLEGWLPRVTYLPDDAGILFNEHRQPAQLAYDGQTLTPQPEPVELLWDGIFFDGTMQLFADRDEVVVYPGASEVEVHFRVTLEGEPAPGWWITTVIEPEDTTDLQANLRFGEVQEDGTFPVQVSVDRVGQSSFTVNIEDTLKGLALEGTLPVEVLPRESIYQGLGCDCDSTVEGPAWLAVLALLGLGFFRRRRLPGTTALLLVVVSGMALGATPARAAEAESKLPKLAFLGVTPGAGVDEPTAESISDYIQTLTAGTKGYQLIRLTEVKQMLGFEAQRQLLGCEDGNCMSDIAGALDVDRLLRASVSRLGESMVVQLTLLDGVNSTQLSATGMRLEKAPTAEPVLDVMPDLLNELFAADPRFEGKSVRHRSRNTRSYSRERRWSFGAGADLDLSHGGGTMLGAHISYRGRFFGFGLGFLPRMGKTPATGAPAPVGMRGEIRLRLFSAGPVHPHLAVGATYFPKDMPLLRAALYTEIDIHRWIRAFVSIAGEALPTETAFQQTYLLLNLGVAITP